MRFPVLGREKVERKGRGKRVNNLLEVLGPSGSLRNKINPI